MLNNQICCDIIFWDMLIFYLKFVDEKCATKEGHPSKKPVDLRAVANGIECQMTSPNFGNKNLMI